MQLSIVNNTGGELDVYWGKCIGVRTAHHGVLPAYSDAVARDQEGELLELHAGETVWVRGTAPDGRVVATTVELRDDVTNMAQLSTQWLSGVDTLTLPEELLLLALDDHGKTHDVSPTNLELGLLAAALAELELRGRIRVHKGTLDVLDGQPVADQLQCAVLCQLAALERPAACEAAFAAVLPNLNLRRLATEGLIARGVLRSEESRLLWLIPHWSYSTADTIPETHLLHRLLKVLTLGFPADDRTSILLAIASRCFSTGEYLREELFADMRSSMQDAAAHAPVAELELCDAMNVALQSEAELEAEAQALAQSSAP